MEVVTEFYLLLVFEIKNSQNIILVMYFFFQKTVNGPFIANPWSLLYSLSETNNDQKQMKTCSIS